MQRIQQTSDSASFPLTTNGEQTESQSPIKKELDYLTAKILSRAYTKEDPAARLAIASQLASLIDQDGQTDTIDKILMMQFTAELNHQFGDTNILETIFKKLEDKPFFQDKLLDSLTKNITWVELTSYIIQKQIVIAEKYLKPIAAGESKEDNIFKRKPHTIFQKILFNAQQLDISINEERTVIIATHLTNLITQCPNDKNPIYESLLLLNKINFFSKLKMDSIKIVLLPLVKDDEYCSKLLTSMEANLNAKPELDAMQIQQITFVLENTATFDLQKKALALLIWLLAHPKLEKSDQKINSAIFRNKKITEFLAQHIDHLPLTILSKDKLTYCIHELLIDREREKVDKTDANENKILLALTHELHNCLGCHLENETGFISLLNRMKKLIPFEMMEIIISKLTLTYSSQISLLTFAQEYYADKVNKVKTASAKYLLLDEMKKKINLEVKADQVAIIEMEKKRKLEPQTTLGEFYVNLIHNYFNANDITERSERFLCIKKLITGSIDIELKGAANHPIYPNLDLFMLFSVENANDNAIKMQQHVVSSLINYTNQNYWLNKNDEIDYFGKYRDRTHYFITVNRLLMDFAIQLSSLPEQSQFVLLVNERTDFSANIKTMLSHLDARLEFLYTATYYNNSDNQDLTINKFRQTWALLLNSPHATAVFVLNHVPQKTFLNFKTNTPLYLALCASLLILTANRVVKENDLSSFWSRSNYQRDLPFLYPNIKNAIEKAQKYLSRKTLGSKHIEFAKALSSIVNDAIESKSVISNSFSYIWTQLEKRALLKNEAVLKNALAELAARIMDKDQFEKYIKSLKHNGFITMPLFSTKPSAPLLEEKSSINFSEDGVFKFMKPMTAVESMRPSAPPLDEVKAKPTITVDVAPVITVALAPVTLTTQEVIKVQENKRPAVILEEIKYPVIDSKIEQIEGIPAKTSTMQAVVTLPIQVEVETPKTPRTQTDVKQPIQIEVTPSTTPKKQSFAMQPIQVEATLPKTPIAPPLLTPEHETDSQPGETKETETKAEQHQERLSLANTTIPGLAQPNFCAYNPEEIKLTATIDISENEPGYLLFTADFQTSTTIPTPISFRISLFENQYSFNGKTPLKLSSPLYYDTATPFSTPEEAHESIHCALNIKQHSQKLVFATTEITTLSNTSTHLKLSIFKKKQEISSNGTCKLPTLVFQRSGH